jgi:oligoribonuclease NrnB/cAMP/cGMP phosphodiesterase (DHH superfamily)
MDKICFYHDDLDGYCSAAIVYNYYNGNIELQKINHGEIDFLKDIKDYNEVYFVDFTPPIEYVITLFKNNKYLTILDHHKTADEIHKELQGISSIVTVLDLDHAGCMVTWQHFYPHDEEPLVVKLVEDMDIWKWKYSETEDFVNGMDLNVWKNQPTNELWSFLLHNDSTVRNIVSGGSMITEYKKIYNSQLLESLSYEAIFNAKQDGITNGYKILVINAPKNNSKVFGDKINNYPFVAIYSHKRDQYNISLYSATGFDTTTISKKMVDKNGNRGGGHAGASGFKCETLPWIPIKEGE